MQTYFYTRRHDHFADGYITYLVSGHFTCEGDLNSTFFPYH
jgi:hypothetical protein